MASASFPLPFGPAAGAEQQAASGEQQTSTFPLPPAQYVSQYTEERVASGTAPPPPPPPHDWAAQLDPSASAAVSQQWPQYSYRMFDALCTSADHAVRGLEESGLRRLHPPPPALDHKRELKKMNFSVLVNFLDLLDLLSLAPDSPKRVEKLNDLELLLIHMAHLSNEFRPHQAREQLSQLLAHQRSERSQVCSRFGVALSKLRARWLALRDSEPAPSGSASAAAGEPTTVPAMGSAAYDAYIESLCTEDVGERGSPATRVSSDLPELGVYRFSGRPPRAKQQRQPEATASAAEPMDVGGFQLTPEDDVALQTLLSQLSDPDF